MKFKILLFCILLFSSANLIAQNINTNPFWEGEIKLNDGTIKKGFVQVPNNPAQSGVSFKKTGNGKNERVRKRDIESVKVISKSGKVYEFEPIPIVATLNGNASIGKELVLISNQNDYVKFYVSYGVYRVDKNGEIYMLYRFMQGKDFPTLSYIIKKRDHEKGRLFHMTNLARGFKKSANHYLTEDPQLLKRINNGELNFKDIDEIISAYMESTKNL